MNRPALRTALVLERAEELGFVAAGATPTGPVEDIVHFDTWVADGLHADMDWLPEHRDVRADTRRIDEAARTVISVAAPYGDLPAHVSDDRISRYALGVDYHEVMRGRLRQLASFLSAETGAPVFSRPAVDSAPVLERSLAARAGLGWIGKSAMLLHQNHGSYVLLGELFTPVELDPTDRPHPDRCGRCTRCLDLCPTGAIIAHGRVDARRCISWLTIENRGPIARPLRPLVGHRLFGCDVCQSVCPWNNDARLEPWDEFRPLPSTLQTDTEELLWMSNREFERRFRSSPLRRAQRRGIARNAAVVLGNLGDESAVPALAAALAMHETALVRGHCAWALARIGGRRARTALDFARRFESNDYVIEEIRWALDQLPGG